MFSIAILTLSYSAIQQHRTFYQSLSSSVIISADKDVEKGNIYALCIGI